MERGSSNAFTSATSSNTTLAITQDPSRAGEDKSSAQGVDVVISASMTSLPGPSSSQVPDIPSQQEAIASDSASNIDVDEILYNIRMRSSSLNIPNEQSGNYYFDNSSQAGSLASQIWSDRASPEIKPDSSDTFEFLIKSISSANNYISMLTREQLSVLRSIRPGLLYEFLQEIARVRSERRMRRALPHECAFCKNNGENEDIYASHALKDFRGRVLCPVLRAFSCPKCGATGERAHTIKYCPENIEIGSERFVSRRRFPPSNSLIVGATTTTNGTGYDSITPNTPASSPLPSLTATWNNFHLN